ncbi:MAG: hypothetical protein N4A65_15120 [Cohaesibacter sp.]|jgi:hypothetical protein|nr:hypothetical protein [Cohaesibacter sp.]
MLALIVCIPYSAPYVAAATRIDIPNAIIKWNIHLFVFRTGIFKRLLVEQIQRATILPNSLGMLGQKQKHEVGQTGFNHIELHTGFHS